mmetsp:Transcript_30645/g.64274  ORF Transcript_30645/g.64274 Transcript_30645/m.64274 type:complete len:80 (+) Transcript_30645:186-425(+)
MSTDCSSSRRPSCLIVPAAGGCNLQDDQFHKGTQRRSVALYDVAVARPSKPLAGLSAAKRQLAVGKFIPPQLRVCSVGR